MTLHEFLRHARVTGEERDSSTSWSQAAVAERARQLGCETVHQTRLSEWERGASIPNGHQLAAVCGALKLSQALTKEAVNLWVKVYDLPAPAADVA